MSWFAKLKSTRGETITESLVGALIIGLVIVVLAAAIVVATTLNTQVSNADTAFTYGEKSGTIEVTINVPDVEDGSATVERDGYVSTTPSDRQYLYYEKAPESHD